MIRVLKATFVLAMVLGFVLSLPGLLLLAASQITTVLVGREQVAREQALDLEVL